MDKVVAVWSGWSGSPGYSNFYFTGDSTGADLTGITGAVRAFFAAFTLSLPTPVSVKVSQVVQQIDPVTGNLQSEKTAPADPAVVVGAGGANFSSPAGACVIWRTTGTRNGHIIKGKTFLVPLTTAAYDTDGTIVANRLTELRAAAVALSAYAATGGAKLGVWSRPVAGAGGGITATSTATVNDRSAILKSRRA
jgi:hypothetical protein